MNCCSPARFRRAPAKLLAEYPELAELLDPISRGEAVEGMEALGPVLVDDLALVLHELPAGAHVVVCDPERVRTRSADLVRTSQEFLDASWAVAAGGGQAPVDLGAASLRELDTVQAEARALGLPWWGITALTEPDATASVFGSAPSYRGDTDAALADLKTWAREGWRDRARLRRARLGAARGRAAGRGGDARLGWSPRRRSSRAWST